MVSHPLTDLRGTLPMVGIVTLTVTLYDANSETQIIVNPSNRSLIRIVAFMMIFIKKSLAKEPQRKTTSHATPRRLNLPGTPLPYSFYSH